MNLIYVYFKSKLIFNLTNRHASNGEEKAASLAQAIFTYEYLKFIGQSDSLKANNVKNLIKERYQKILKSKTSSGSFNMWKDSSESIWLTSYVVQILSEARDIIEIDEQVIKDALKYIIGKQNMADGSFDDETLGTYRNIVPTLSKNYLTAFTLLALLKNHDLNDTISYKSSSEKALNYLKKEIPKSDVDYDRSIATYALALANQTDESKIFFEKIIHNYKKSNKTELQGVFIEIISYVTLASLSNNDITSAFKSVSWLIKHRVQNGGFPSSFDNFIALKAISEFLLQSNSNQDTRINLKLQKNGKFFADLAVNNLLDTKHFEIEALANLEHGNFFFQFNGKGLAYANLWYQYAVNIENNNNNFIINADLQELHKHQKKLILSVKQSPTKVPRFIIMEVSLPSGFIYQSHKDAKNIKVSLSISNIYEKETSDNR